MFKALTREHRYLTSSFCAAVVLFLVTTCSRPAETASVTKACSYAPHDLASCVEPFVANFKSLSPHLQLQYYCRAMEEATACMDTKACVENTTDRMVQQKSALWHGLKDGVNFVCSNEKEYKKHSVCLSDKTTLNSLKFCESTPPSTPITDEEGCNMINEMYTCVRKIITVKCGEEAARFMYRVSKMVVQPMLTPLNCVLEDVNNKQSSLASSQHHISSLWIALSSLILAGCYKII